MQHSDKLVANWRVSMQRSQGRLGSLGSAAQGGMYRKGEVPPGSTGGGVAKVGGSLVLQRQQLRRFYTTPTGRSGLSRAAWKQRRFAVLVNIPLESLL